MSDSKLIFCKVCKKPTRWRRGAALKNRQWISADFPGDYEGPAEEAPDSCIGQTMNINMRAVDMIEVLKCTMCGRSIRV